MKMNNQPTTAAELCARIRALAADADWTADELRAALAEEGVDAEALVRDAKGALGRMTISDLLKSEQTELLVYVTNGNYHLIYDIDRMLGAWIIWRVQDDRRKIIAEFPEADEDAAVREFARLVSGGEER
jgi:hypothetical protein